MNDETREDGGLDLGGGDGAAPGDPFADVPAAEPEEVEATLGGDGATLEELQQEEGGEQPEGDPPPLPEAEPEAEPESEPEPEAEAPEPEPEPEPEPAAPEPEASAGGGDEAKAAEPKGESKKQGTSERPYVVLVENEQGGWDKTTDKPVEAANGDIALREAYAALVPADAEDTKTLVVIPGHFWKPKTVAAKKKVSRAVEIS